MAVDYHSAEWLSAQYWGKGRTLTEIADLCDVSHTTIREWMNKHDIPRRGQSEAQIDDLQPYHDPEWLRREYWENERSLHNIADECDVTGAAVLKWMRKHDIERRTVSESMRSLHVSRDTEFGEFGGIPGGWVSYKCRRYGTDKHDRVKEHQLVAIAEGADPYKIFSNGEYQVHHKNGLRWDNRPRNLEVLTGEEHDKLHAAKRERTSTGEFV